MKKYLSGILALLLAVGFSSFMQARQTKPLTPFYLFETPSTTQDELIEDPHEWVYIGEIGQVSATCPTEEAYKACQLVLDASDVEPDPSFPLTKKRIKSTVSITSAVNYDVSGNYVASVTNATNPEIRNSADE